jgi:hypothetical protein
MKITFDLDLDGNRFFNENDLDADLDSLRPLILEFDNPEGVLHFEDPENDVSFELGDSMGPLIYSMCFGPIKSLAEGKPVEIPFSTCDASVKLVPNGDEVVFSWEGSEPYRLGRSELLPALVSCGERYVAFMKRLYNGDPNYAAELDDLASAAQNARACLPS